jgi:adenosylmethionine-8-amino-7-oxononanoate aminotransferase
MGETRHKRFPVRWESHSASAQRGLYLMTHWNMIMVLPPLTITRGEVDETSPSSTRLSRSPTSTPSSRTEVPVPTQRARL